VTNSFQNYCLLRCKTACCCGLLSTRLYEATSENLPSLSPLWDLPIEPSYICFAGKRHKFSFTSSSVVRKQNCRNFSGSSNSPSLLCFSFTRAIMKFLHTALGFSAAYLPFPVLFPTCGPFHYSRSYVKHPTCVVGFTFVVYTEWPIVHLPYWFA
jgi:hypothetical protein